MKFNLSLLFCLLENGFSLDEIAFRSQKSPRTVQYKLTKFGLSLKTHSVVDDGELDNVISECLASTPNIGY